MNLVKKVQIFIEKYHMIKKGGRVLVGVSGGADSVCLLLVLHELEKTMGFSLAAVHVEHGIRGVESLADAVFVEKLCKEVGVPFRKFSVDVLTYSEQTHQSLEEAARKLRYDCFVQACAEMDADVVAVAHHANDNAETMLFHLARGTGIRGLGGIAPIVNYRVSENVCGAIKFAPVLELEEYNIMVLRPLLGVTRVEIEKYLDVCRQAYRTDSTNVDLEYTRNRIRGRILPELVDINAQAVSHMGKTAEQLREITEYLDEAALCEGAGAYEVVYTKLPLQTDGMENLPKNVFFQTNGAETEGTLIGRIRIFSEPFLAMHRVLQSTLMHYLIGVIAGSEKDITSGHIEQVLKLFVMREGRRTDLPYGISARRCAAGIELYHREKGQDFQNMPAEICLDLPAPGTLLLENGDGIRSEIIEFDGDFEKIPKKTYTKWMDYDKIKGNVLLRTRRPGDYLQIDAEGGRKKLKRYFIDEKIPEDEREGTLLVADGSHVLWVVGHRISEACKVTNETRRVLCLQYFMPQMPEI